MRFNIRVYGLYIKNSKILLSEEFIRNNWIVKFPGGGLEFGEGTIDGLKREFKEELGLDIVVDQHFYTTDFFVKSVFDESQVISIYYYVDTAQTDVVIPDPGPLQRFIWCPIAELSEQQMSLIIDKKVAQMLQVKFKNLV